MRGFVRGCAAHIAGRARDPLGIPAYAILSGLRATAWYFQTDAVPRPWPPPGSFLARRSVPPTIANAPVPRRQNRFPDFEARKVPPPSPLTLVAWKSARSPWLSLPFQSQHTPHHPGNPLPIFSFYRKLLLAPCGYRVKLGLAVVLRRSPLRSDPPLLQQTQQ